MRTRMAGGQGRARPRTSWRFIVLLALCLPPAAAPVASSPLKAPKRLVHGQTVNLTPLFHWWTNRHGDRPLTAWVHVTGTIAATNGLDWAVLGQAEQSSARARVSGGEVSSQTGPPRLILKNPPVQELEDFQKLRDQFNQANAERSRLQNELTSAKAGVTQVQRSTRGSARRVALADLRQVGQIDNELLKTVNQQIGTLRGKLAAYPSPDHYQVDALALDTGAEHNHLPVYDHGSVVK